MEAIILIISWHYRTLKMTDKSKTKHVQKTETEIINYNSNNNDLKDKKESQI